MAVVKVLTGAENTTLDKNPIYDTIDAISETAVDGDNVREEALITSSFADNSVFGGHQTTHAYGGSNPSSLAGYLSDSSSDGGNQYTTASGLDAGGDSEGWLLLNFGGNETATAESFRWHNSRTSAEDLTGAVVVRASCQIHWGPAVNDGVNYGMEYASAPSAHGPTVVECMIRYAIETSDSGFGSDPNSWDWLDIPYTRQRFGMSWSSVPGASEVVNGAAVATESSLLVTAPGNYSANFNYTGVAAITSNTDTTTPSPTNLHGKYIRFGLFAKLTEGETGIRVVTDDDGITIVAHEVQIRFRCGTITATHVLR